jgi:anthranilate synthase/aminodeoxychorismate synthase-like glutamine amidotransferase
VILLLDNFDSFTYNLVDYFHQLGVQVQVERNDRPLAEIVRQPYSGVVLSPGPEVPSKAGNLMEVLGHYAPTHPVLGICLGHQAIGAYFGAQLVKAEKPMHGKISDIEVEPKGLFQGLPARFKVVRYHSWLIRDLPDSLQATAYTPQGELMALRHRTLPIAGVQFHPEAVLTQYGLEMLENWITLNNVK